MNIVYQKVKGQFIITLSASIADRQGRTISVQVIRMQRGWPQVAPVYAQTTLDSGLRWELSLSEGDLLAILVEKSASIDEAWQFAPAQRSAVTFLAQTNALRCHKTDNPSGFVFAVEPITRARKVSPGGKR